MSQRYNQGLWPPPPWRAARVVENREMAEGSLWLTLQAVDDEPARYEPGHVLSLALKNTDGSLQRHAYTVSSAEPAGERFSHLYRVIRDGRLTPRFKRLEVGNEVYFHGPFHTPIQEEIAPDATRIVGVATGTGIGPLYGFAVKALAEGEARAIAVYVSFRRFEDVALLPELGRLARQHENFLFDYSLTEPPPVWSGLIGRVQEAVPVHLRDLDRTHLHIVGRGDMVHVWQAAWLRAGFAPSRVSIETYFHHHARPGEAEVDALAQVLSTRK